ncbi:MAG: trigger factor [Kiritimatiellae bacterium]|nr:trigger factor [Kiritimatiellia bacterium]
MKVESHKAGPCRVKLIVNAGADETRPEQEKVLREYLTHGRVPGFRPGKAPREVIERHYQRGLTDDIRSALISKLHRQAIESERLKVANIVDVTDVIFSPDTGISFVLVVDVVPEFKLPKYQKITLKVNEVNVTDEQVEAQMGMLRRSVTRYEDTDGAVAAGDIAQIDYSATCDGKPMAEAVADSGRYAADTDFWAQASEPEFIPGMSKALIGLKAGDTRDVPVAFDKEFRLEALRGRKAVYRVNVKHVRRALPPEDTELAKHMGFDEIGKLRERLRETLMRGAQQKEDARQRQEVSEYLLKKCEFELPQSVVAEETQRALRMLLGDITQRGGTREFVEKNREEIIGTATTTAQQRTRLNYILAAIAAEQKIEISEADLEKEIDELAMGMRTRGEHDMTAKKLREQMVENRGIEHLRHDMLGAKTLDWLVADAKTK